MELGASLLLIVGPAIGAMSILTLIFVASLVTARLLGRQVAAAHALIEHLRHVLEHQHASVGLQVTGTRMIVADHLGMEALRL